MQFIYDNIVATIIATTVTMILVTIQLRAMQTNVAKTSRNIVKQEAENFASWLEDDLEDMGANIDQDEEVAYEAPVDSSLTDSTSMTTAFTFYRDSLANNGQDTVRVATRYRVRKKGAREVDGESEDLFQLIRKQKIGGGPWATVDVKGASVPALGYFDIDLLDRNANVVASPVSNDDQVHSTRVRFSVVAPFQNKRTTLPVTHVGSVLLLQKDNETPGSGNAITVPETEADCTSGGWKALNRPDGSEFDNAAECKIWVTGSPSAGT